MLPKENRLSSNFEYQITKKYGKYASGNFFHIYVLKPKNYEGPAKVGFVVSNKTSKNATDRNRVKRVFREVLRLNFDKITAGYWVVIYPKVISLGKNYEEICTDFNKVLQKDLFTD
jgi:ribonuclease P protein component